MSHKVEEHEHTVESLERELDELRAEQEAALQASKTDFDCAAAWNVVANRCAAGVARVSEMLSTLRGSADAGLVAARLD